jgi:hypothetical protein
MPNTLLTINMVTNEALMVLRNNLVFTKRVNREYDKSFGVTGAKIGTTLNVRKPPRFLGTFGPALNVEDITETQVPLTLTTQFHVDLNFTSADLLLNIDEFSNRLIKPAIATIANRVDYDGLQQYQNIYNATGTPGTVPSGNSAYSGAGSALLTYLKAGVFMDNSGAPVDDERSLVMTSWMQANAVDSLKGLFQSSQQISEQYIKGKMGVGGGFNWYMDQNVGTQTYGVQGGTPAVNGAGQTGTSLVTNGWTAAALQRVNVGDIFTIGSGSTQVDSVNPQSRADTTFPQQFVVTAPGISDGSGNMTLSISPAITPYGQFQTVTTSPATGAVLTFMGAASTVSPQALAFHRDAFTFATADLPLPSGVDIASRAADTDTGLSIRLVRQYDINQDKFPCRLDILYGWATLRPELACRIAA